MWKMLSKAMDNTCSGPLPTSTFVPIQPPFRDLSTPPKVPLKVLTHNLQLILQRHSKISANKGQYSRPINFMADALALALCPAFDISDMGSWGQPQPPLMISSSRSINMTSKKIISIIQDGIIAGLLQNIQGLTRFHFKHSIHSQNCVISFIRQI